MMANMADGPSWTSAMAGRVDLAATTHAPASPLNMMKPVPAAMAPSGASGPEKTSVANETAKTRPPKATVAPMPSACAASPSAGGMNGSEVSSCCWTGFVFDEGSPTARGGRTMRALTLRDRDEGAAIHATPTPTRFSPDPSPRPESRSEAAAISLPAPRDLTDPRRFPGGAESDARAMPPLFGRRPIAPVDAILARGGARGGAATPRALARLGAVDITRACQLALVQKRCSNTFLPTAGRYFGRATSWGARAVGGR